MLPWNIRPNRVQLSLTYCSTCLLFGFVAGGMGPLVPFKAKELEMKQTDLGWAFSVKGIGGLLGCFVAPLLESYVKINKIIAAACAIVGLCSVAMVGTESFLLFCAACFFMGMMMMFINIFDTVALIRVQPKQSTETWIKALHFTFGIGAFVSPLIMAYVGTVTAFKTYPLLALVSACLLFFYDHPQSQQVDSVPTDCQENVENVRKPIPPLFDNLIFTFLFVYAGIQVSYWGWISTYGTMSPSITTEEAMYGTSIFWTAMTAGRGLAIPLAYILSNWKQIILLLSGVLCAISSCIYFTRTGQQHNILYIGSGLMGLFCSAQYPLMMNLPNSLGMITNTRNTSKYALGGSIGQSLLPLVTGFVMSWLGRNALFGFELFMILTAWTIYLYSLKVAFSASEEKQMTEIELSLTNGDLYKKLNG